MRLRSRTRPLHPGARMTYMRRAIRGSSVVEQPAVNRLVVGSNPTRGAISFRTLRKPQQNQQIGSKRRDPCWTRVGRYTLPFPFRLGTTEP